MLFRFLLWLFCVLGIGPVLQAGPGQEISVLAWNIWHGGREDGEEAGPRRVMEVIRESGADLVAMQETYGSGERISGGLGFHFHERGTNVSIHSRFPVLEDISVFEEFQCVGALVELPDGSLLAFYSIWLPYDEDIWLPGTREGKGVEELLAACNASADSLEAIRAGIEERLADPRYAGVPIVIAGDFNSMSHLDSSEVGRGDHGLHVDWATSHVLMDVGYRDAYREVTPYLDRSADATWSPRFPEQEQDRIDFVYYRSERWRSREARVLREHSEGFPSDHAAVLCVLEERQPPPTSQPLRIVSYNIKHGAGMDGRVDLERTARVLAALEADVIALQEIDQDVERSGRVNQMNELGKALDMHPAFGSFMDYQGGRYGMGLLSRHPIVNARSLDLPPGDEPRIALLAEIRLPDGASFFAVDVHFNWVRDDTLRFAQAQRLVEHLESLEHPYVLLGDFNDRPGSRTLELFQAIAVEAIKPAEARFTFPSDTPEREIDFLFLAPEGAWQHRSTRVVPEALASDHRPVLADVLWKGR